MKACRAALLPLLCVVALVAAACTPPPDTGESNVAPTAVANADVVNGQAPLLVQFSPAGSVDPDGFIESYSWNFGDGSPTSSAPNPSHTYATGGVFTATLTVTDDGGKTATAAVVITTTPPDNLAPIATIGASTLSGKTPLTVDFNSSGSSDPDGTIVGYEWGFGDGEISTSPTASHTYLVPGTFVVTLKVTDNNGATNTDSTLVTVVDNLAPTAQAVATPPTGKAPLAVSFSGAGSTDEDGNVVAWAWDFGGGATGTGEVAIHVFDEVGTYPVVLTVTDDDGATDVTTISVTVNPNQAPVAIANATPDGTKAPLGVVFSSAGSIDNDGSIIGYHWDFGDGASSTSANPSHLYTAAGDYEVVLTVTDDDFAESTATVNVPVGPPNVPPVAVGSADPAVGKPVLDVQFDSDSSTDSDGTIVSYTWDFGDGSATSTDPNPTHAYTDLGNYTALLTVTDSDGASHTVGVAVSVIPNSPPTAAPTATPAVGKEPLTVQLSAANAIDVDGEIVSYEWDYTNDGTVDSTDVETSFDYIDPGTYTASLTVTDEDGATDTGLVTITVNPNQAPTAVANADIQAGNAPLTVVFEGRDSLDAELEGVITYEWDFGDGSEVSTSSNPTHVFQEIGVYTVTLTVTDDNGASDTDTLTITTYDPVVRVSSTGDDVTGDGTPDAPYASIPAAILGALDQEKTVVAVAGGTYGGFSAASGVSVHGGYDQSFEYGGDDGSTEVTIQAAPGATAVTVAGATLGLSLKDLTIQGGGGANATAVLISGSTVALDNVTVDSGSATGAGSSAYGVRAINGSNVTVLDSDITARDGVGGADGADGTVGASGSNGGAGTAVQNGGAPLNTASPLIRTGGNGGGTVACALAIIICLGASPGAGGGVGGDLTASPNRGGGGGSGGATSSGGGGGGEPGLIAPAAGPGAAGAAVPGETFDAGTGGTGGVALPGAGGGGGGSGAANGGSGAYSGGGGAGGAGGVTGSGGAGGNGGGGSFAVYSYNSSVTIVGGTLNTGDGGQGGQGGQGGAGGAGGAGGQGGPRNSNRGAGGGGGGGAGGNGGGGGAGGNGGPSVGAYHAGTGTQVVAAADEAALANIGAGGTGGTGGNGGTGGAGGGGGLPGTGSSGGAGSPGEAADAGAAGTDGVLGTAGLRRVSFDNGVPGNVVPVAAAASTGTSGIAPETITFSSAGSYDADGTITYGWDFGDGNTSTEANPTHTYTQDGEFTAVLTVTDDDGATATSSVGPITIAANQLPTAVANGTPDKENLKAPLVVDFSSAGSGDGDGTIVTYDWDFGDGVGTSSDANPTYTYDAEGVYEVVLTITDDKGGTDTATVTVTVTPHNVAPEVTISATPQFGKSPNEVTFSSTYSDSDGTVESIEWDFGDGSATTDTPNPVHTYGVGVFVATFTVTDDDGATTTKSLEIRSLPNVPPVAVASASPSDGRAPLTTTLSSAGSIDYDGTITGYLWDFGDGSATSTSPNPSHTYAAGTWTATLTVTDNEGATHSSTVVVSSTVNQVPTAVANATPLGSGDHAPLDVAFSSDGSVDNDGTISTYHWDFGDGTTPSNDPNPTHTYMAQGPYTATLTLTDDEGGVAVTTVNVLVGPPNAAPAPIASATPDDGRAPLEVEFSSAGSDDEDGEIVLYEWDFGDGSDTTNVPNPTHTYGPGTFTATLTVTDDDGATASVPVTINSTVNQNPTAVAAADIPTGLAPLDVEFSSAGSDDVDGTIVDYIWDFGDGGTSDDPNPTHTYAAGVWTATLYVVDNEGGIGSTTVQIISNLAPTAVAESDVTTGDGPLEVSFTGSGSTDPDDEIVSYEWDFGDGATSTAADPTHTYAPGIWTATLTVTDGRGASSTASIEIDVNDPPVAGVTSNVTSGSAPLTVNFTGSASDSDGTFSFTWDFDDGSPLVTSTLNPSHTFTSAGTYDVTLTVTDDDGATATAVRTITVS